MVFLWHGPAPDPPGVWHLSHFFFKASLTPDHLHSSSCFSQLLKGTECKLSEKIMNLEEHSKQVHGEVGEILDVFKKDIHQEITLNIKIFLPKKFWLRFQDLFEMRREMKVPLSMCFTAYKDDEYCGKGEENLKFSGCSLNTKDIMDPK